MHGLRSVAGRQPVSVEAHKVAIHALGKKRREWRHRAGQRHQHAVQRHVGRTLVGDVAAVTLPESPARTPHVPLRQVLDELLDGTACRAGLVTLHRLTHGVDGLRQPGKTPAVEDRKLFGLIDHRRRGVEAIDLRVRDEEGIHVPERQHEQADNVLKRLTSHSQLARLGPRRVEEPAGRIGAELVEDGPRSDDIAPRLGHLLALAIDDHPHDHAVAVGGLVKQQRALGEQREEPPACLVEALGDEVRGMRALEELAVLERVMALRERHRARVVPAVDHVRDASHHAAALETRHGHRVDIRLVEIVVGGQPDVGGAADAVCCLALLADPDRQRRSPVAAPREVPVDEALQPVAHASVANVRGLPLDAAVVLDEAFLDRCGADEP